MHRVWEASDRHAPRVVECAYEYPPSQPCLTYRHMQTAPEGGVTVRPLASKIFQRLDKQFDAVHGGFGGAPKFPSPAQTLHFLSRYAAFHLSDPSASAQDKRNAEKARDMAVFTITKIYNGGIRDVVGGGFSRYSVDEHWHVPHCVFPVLQLSEHRADCSASSREDAVSSTWPWWQSPYSRA